MSTTQPIRDSRKLKDFEEYYLECRPNVRNHTLLVLGLNTALRISDLIRLKWDDVYDAETGCFRRHVQLQEQKTGKFTRIALNHSAVVALSRLRVCCGAPGRDSYLFTGQKNRSLPISRYQAYRIVRTAARSIGLDDCISCHSLRKTFGYHAWKNGIPPAVIMNIYNHSSYQVTRRYLGIDQDDRDEVFLNLNL